MLTKKGANVTNIKKDFNRCWIPSLEVQQRPVQEEKEDKENHLMTDKEECEVNSRK